jgi:DNA-directed RNA polymerase subunit RPC12/RpoP
MIHWEIEYGDERRPCPNCGAARLFFIGENGGRFDEYECLTCKRRVAHEDDMEELVLLPMETAKSANHRKAALRLARLVKFYRARCRECQIINNTFPQPGK